MKFSIVTISYNQGKYLRECIESVLNQENVNIEYIVVDPGSVDESKEIINSYFVKNNLWNKDYINKIFLKKDSAKIYSLIFLSKWVKKYNLEKI